MIRTPENMRCENRERMRDGQGTTTIQHLFEPGEFGPGANVRLCARLTLPPGASIGSHDHVNEDEVYVILSGTGELDDGQSRTIVAAGAAVLTGRGESHAIANIGDTPLELLAFIVLYS